MVTVMFIERRKVKKKSWEERRKLNWKRSRKEGKRREGEREKIFQTKAYTKLMVDLSRKPRILN